MGHCHCRNQRLLSPSRKALPHAKSRLDCHRRHLDAMVLHHKTPEFTVRFVPFFIISLPLPPLFFYIYIFLPYPLTYLTLTSKKKKTRLAAVNFFLGCVGVTQVSRIFMYHRSQKSAGGGGGGESLAKEIETKAKGAVDTVKSVVKKQT